MSFFRWDWNLLARSYKKKEQVGRDKNGLLPPGYEPTRSVLHKD